MTNFALIDYPAQHAGVARMERAAQSLKQAAGGFDRSRMRPRCCWRPSRSLLGLVANQVAGTWTEGHLLAAWIVLWTVAFAAIALCSLRLPPGRPRATRWTTSPPPSARPVPTAGYWQAALLDPRGDGRHQPRHGLGRRRGRPAQLPLSAMSPAVAAVLWTWLLASAPRSVLQRLDGLRTRAPSAGPNAAASAWRPRGNPERRHPQSETAARGRLFMGVCAVDQAASRPSILDGPAQPRLAGGLPASRTARRAVPAPPPGGLVDADHAFELVAREVEPSTSSIGRARRRTRAHARRPGPRRGRSSTSAPACSRRSRAR